jgi:hypothetical protein
VAGIGAHGKQPLAMDEIATLLEWIRNGAVFSETATVTPLAKDG